MSKKEDTRQHIIDCVITCIKNGTTYEQLSMRNISKSAGVSLGLINYHFQSKDVLINIATEAMLAESVTRCQVKMALSNVTPEERLIAFILDLTDVFYENLDITKLYLTSSFNGGSLQSSLFIIPILREIFPSVEEKSLKIKALQIVLPMQYAFIREDIFNPYMGIDESIHVDDAKKIIEKMIRNIIKN